MKIKKLKQGTIERKYTEYWYRINAIITTNECLIIGCLYSMWNCLRAIGFKKGPLTCFYIEYPLI